MNEIGYCGTHVTNGVHMRLNSKHVILIICMFCAVCLCSAPRFFCVGLPRVLCHVLREYCVVIICVLLVLAEPLLVTKQYIHLTM